MCVGDGVPECAEEQPADDERRSKHDDGVAPAQVDERRENVDNVVK